jgi:membrane-bound lytic murein transglycosylase MltF
MKRTITIAVLTIPFLLSACRSKPAQPEKTTAQPAQAPTQEKAGSQPVQPTDVDTLPDIAPKLKVPWKGDLDEIAKRRLVRVLLPFRRPEFFYMEGRPVGMLQEAFQELENVLNKKYNTTAANRIVVALLPTPHDKIAGRMMGGYGDITAASVSITEARKASVDFTIPTYTGVKIIPVTGPGAPELKSLDDLSGKEVWVNSQSQAKQALKHLNAKLAAKGLPPAKVRDSDPVLEPGDVMEMVNAGLYPIALMKSVHAEFWARVFDNLKPRMDLPLTEDVEFGWVVQKGTPQLKAFLDDFIKTHGIGTVFGNTLAKRYLKSDKYVKNATDVNEMKKFRASLPHFKQYSKQYNLDYLLMAAQGYQESRLDQSVKSPVGAIGIMQVMPTTAAGAPVKIPNVQDEKNNIHAGTRLMHFLIEEHFNEPQLTILNRMLFAMAAYNAGPAKIEKCRKLAAEMGYDPNVWFDNVEVAVAKVVGRETTQYVANIYKYYVAYKLASHTYERRMKAEKKVGKTT